MGKLPQNHQLEECVGRVYFCCYFCLGLWVKCSLMGQYLGLVLDKLMVDLLIKNHNNLSPNEHDIANTQHHKLISLTHK